MAKRQKTSAGALPDIASLVSSRAHDKAGLAELLSLGHAIIAATSAAQIQLTQKEKATVLHSKVSGNCKKEQACGECNDSSCGWVFCQKCIDSSVEVGDLLRCGMCDELFSEGCCSNMCEVCCAGCAGLQRMR